MTRLTWPPKPTREELIRVGALRRSLLEHGMAPYGLKATPTDLARFGLQRWDGLFCGIACVDSPIETVRR